MTERLPFSCRARWWRRYCRRAGSQATVVDTTFDGNRTINGDGGAISVGGTLLNFAPNVTLVNGGILILDNSIFRNNRSARHGGAISAEQLPDNPVIIIDVPVIASIKNSTFEDNEATENGGAIFARNMDGILVQGSEFKDSAAGGDGGAVYLESLPGAVVNNSFSDNTAQGSGDHIESLPDNPGDIVIAGNEIDD